jgi:hypothetical protein
LRFGQSSRAPRSTGRRRTVLARPGQRKETHAPPVMVPPVVVVPPRNKRRCTSGLCRSNDDCAVHQTAAATSRTDRTVHTRCRPNIIIIDIGERVQLWWFLLFIVFVVLEGFCVGSFCLALFWSQSWNPGNRDFASTDYMDRKRTRGSLEPSHKRTSRWRVADLNASFASAVRGSVPFG